MRTLASLSGVGKATLGDFEKLGIKTVEELAGCEPVELYRRICEITGRRHDLCVQDIFRCAIEQARNPQLEPAKRNWWYWSRVRRAERIRLSSH